MDKAVEELQQELKLLKNEIKETLTDVREVLLNTVENPFPHEPAAAPATLPPPPAAAPAPPPQAETPAAAAPPPVAPPPAPVQQAPQMPPGAMVGYPMGGAPIVLGNMGAGGAAPPGASAAEMQAMQATMQAMQAKMASTANTASPEEMQAMQAEMQAMQANVAKLAAGPAEAEAAPPIETSSPAAGPGLPPKSRSAAGPAGKPSAGGRRPGGPGLPSQRGGTPDRRRPRAEKQADDEGPQRSAKTSGRPSRGGPQDTAGRRRKPRGRRHDEDEQYLEAADDVDDGYDDEDDHGEDDYDDDGDRDRYRRGDEHQQPGRPTGKVDLVVLASLAPWLSEGVYQFGRKRVKSLLSVYASMGGIPTEMKDVLLQIVSLDDTEGQEKPVAIHDTMRFLIELDDLMWRGRQDWRRAALMSMIGTNKLAVDLETE